MKGKPVLSEPMRCDDVGTLLAASADDPTLLSEPANEHVTSCLRCQAEQAQYRSILRVMKTLRGDIIAVQPELLGDVLDLVRPPAEVVKFRRPGSDRRRAAIGGIAAAATAGAAGAIVVAARLANGKRLAS
jgi:hypothetical protein